jgi:GT2 family glycosyltransferase
MITRRAYEQHGGFDEGIFMFAEDIDLCYRVRASGLRVHHLGEVSVVHLGGKSATEEMISGVFNRRQGMRYFFEKHYGSWRSVALRMFWALEAVSKITADSLSYWTVNDGRRRFKRQRMQGYALLLRNLHKRCWFLRPDGSAFGR